MRYLRICSQCKLPITDDLRVAREQAICTCLKAKDSVMAINNMLSFIVNQSNGKVRNNG